MLKAHGWRARVLADDNAMVDRAAAHRAGIGWWGKNANLLLPGLGELVRARVRGHRRAGRRRRRRRSRTGAAPAAAASTAARPARSPRPGVVDARRCLSWLLQAEGSFPLEHRVALGDRIYGCDECQEVCPPNRRAPDADADRRRGAPWADLVALLDPDDDVVLARAGRWYIPRREVRYVRRNALVVLGNVGDGHDPAVADLLARYLAHDDPLLRGHAVWAARRLGREDLLAADRAGDRPDGPRRARPPPLR